MRSFYYLLGFDCAVFVLFWSASRRKAVGHSELVVEVVLIAAGEVALVVGVAAVAWVFQVEVGFVSDQAIADFVVAVGHVELAAAHLKDREWLVLVYPVVYSALVFAVVH